MYENDQLSDVTKQRNNLLMDKEEVNWFINTFKLFSKFYRLN